MKYFLQSQNELITQSHVMCMVGLLFSETHVLIRFFIDPSIYYVPHFTLAYFSLTSLSLAGLIIKYSFFKGTAGGQGIESFQHLGIPLSVILLRLFLEHDSSNSLPKIVCLILFLAQCVMIAAKIIYLGSVSKQLAQISGLTKLSRLLKLAVTAIIPQFISGPLPLAIIVTICEIFTICMFIFKYTYQKCSVQYVLLIGVFAGFISSLEAMLCTIFEYDYYFLGECFFIATFLVPHTPLLSLLELKYRLLFTGLAENKSQDQHLAELLFLRQCIFAKHQTLRYSQTTKDQAILQIATLVERTKKVSNKESESIDGQIQEESYLFLGQMQKGGKFLEQSFLQLVLTRFKQTSNFQAFLFTVYCAVQLQQKHVVYAMILFYSFRERTLHKRSNLQQCRYQIVYNEITKHFSSQYKDSHQITFVQFSQNLQELNESIEKCLTDEIQLIQALTNDGKRSDLFADYKLLKQYDMKQKIKKMVEVCFQNKLYLKSNQFKYLYLLYYTSMEKRYSELKKTIKSKFLSVQAKTIQTGYFPKYLTVLNGFSNGQIVNSNQSFKNYFKFSASSQTKSTISQLFPTDKEKRRHNSLMLEAYQQLSTRNGEHSKYECLLAVQAEVNNYKFKVLETFTIATRIYCQNQNGFYYVCELNKLNQENEDTVTILKRERDLLDKRGLTFIANNIRSIKQLDDQYQICDVQGDFRNQSFGTVSKLSNCGQKQFATLQIEIDSTDKSLYDKIKLIQQKMMEQKRANKSDRKIELRAIIELGIILLLGACICLTYWQLSTSIDSLNFTLTVEMKSVRDTNSIRNRIMVQKLILSLVQGTKYFPDSICAYEQISNLSSYFINYTIQDLTINFDDYSSLVVSQRQDADILPQMYAKVYSSVPYLFNYQNNITFQKYLNLLKAKEIYWINQLNMSKTPSIDYRYYSTVFPNQLLSYSAFANGSIYLLDDASTNLFFMSLISVTNQLKVIFSIIILAVGIAIIAFRVKDTIPLIKILAAFESIDNKILSSRLRQLKYSLNLLRRIKTTRIMSLDIDSHGFITIQNDKQVIETKVIQNFTRQERFAHKNNENPGENETEGQSQALLKYRELQSSHNLPESHTIRSLIYNRWYLMVVLLLIGTIIVICVNFLGCFSTKIDALENYEKIDEQLTLLNQKFINIVAYNWLKALSLVTPNFDMTSANQLYSDSLDTFKTINLQKLFYKNYPNSLANQILYGNICKYFLSPELCPVYRNGAFTQGLSVILPFTIKQQIQGAEISTTDYSYYIPNACDKTYILFEGLVPINKKIPLYGLQVVLGSIDSNLTIYIVVISFMVLILFIMTIICQFQRRTRQLKLQDQVLSLDTVNNLYHISDLKPYFNKIYYS